MPISAGTERAIQELPQLMRELLEELRKLNKHNRGEETPGELKEGHRYPNIPRSRR